MKLKITTLIIGTLICFLIVFVLHTICIRENLHFANVERIVKYKKIKKIREIKIENGQNFIHLNHNFIYLNAGEFNTILKINYKNNTQKIKQLNHRNHNANIIGENIYVFDPTVKSCFVYNKYSLRLDKEIKIDKSFDRGIAIDCNNLLLRSVGSDFSKNILSIYTIPDQFFFKTKIQLNDSLENDGGLKTDGFFVIKDSSIAFIQYKKGNFYKISKKADKIKHHNTLDRIQKVEGLKKTKNSYYFDRPSLNVNQLADIYKNEIYIVSFVKDKSVYLKDFVSSRMVDVYSFNTGKYHYSFYLPNDGIHKPNDLIIRSNRLFLLYNTKIAIYDFV